MNTLETQRVIKVVPGSFPRGGFASAIFVGGVVVAEGWARTKGEAKRAAYRSAVDAGLMAAGVWVGR